jgi:predicted transglutaminase-like cysteine proteinase
MFTTAAIKSQFLSQLVVGALAIGTMIVSTGEARSASVTNDPFEVISTGPGVSIKQDAEACSAQPNLPWCASSKATIGKTDTTVSLAEVESIYAAVTKKFDYSYGTQKPWRSSLSNIEADKKWVDDCDGLTFTMLEALNKAGVPKSHLWRVIVTTKANKSYVLHMIGVALIEGSFYIVADTNHDEIIPLKGNAYIAKYSSQVSNGKDWRRAVPTMSLAAAFDD